MKHSGIHTIPSKTTGTPLPKTSGKLTMPSLKKIRMLTHSFYRISTKALMVLFKEEKGRITVYHILLDPTPSPIQLGKRKRS